MSLRIGEEKGLGELIIRPQRYAVLAAGKAIGVALKSNRWRNRTIFSVRRKLHESVLQKVALREAWRSGAARSLAICGNDERKAIGVAIKSKPDGEKRTIFLLKSKAT